MNKRILVSVSGGRSSGLMAWLLWTRFKDIYDLIFVFANTSREKEETLLFVHQLTKILGIPIIWVQAVVHYGSRKGCTHNVVNYETASRDGSIFENVIKKYGIPNSAFLHCTRELKTNPIWSYMKSIKWGHHKKYITAIGYRADETGRIDLEKMNKERQWYPLWEWNIKKPDVATFWLKQHFDLQLADFDGNCKKCHKKTDRKVMTQIVTDPEDLWIDEMEFKYEYFSGGRNANKPPYRFFRKHQSIHDLKEKIKEGFQLSVDQSLITEGAIYDFDPELDEVEYKGCAESCEPF
jgi:3'-phosphoadenosine 5'-phosphosulfate sulfotransferase (PAPS reductase)/FAD synthetase